MDTVQQNQLLFKYCTTAIQTDFHIKSCLVIMSESLYNVDYCILNHKFKDEILKYCPTKKLLLKYYSHTACLS